MTIETNSIGDHAFGVRVRGLSEESLKKADVRQLLRDLLAENGLIVLEGVEPSHRFQVSVGEMFGPCRNYSAGPSEIGQHAVPGVGEVISTPANSTVVEVAGEHLSGWMPWHFDQCYKESPNIVRVLRCGRCVPAGGMTGFLDGAVLYEKLDLEIRKRIELCSVTYALNLALEDLRFGIPAGFRVVRNPRPAASGRAGGDLQVATHRAVRTTPRGQKVLHVSPWMAIGISGCTDAAGDALLRAVVQEILALSGPLAYFHRWELSDMLIWDNLRMLHSSTGFDPALTRIMYRTTIEANGGAGSETRM